jgi:hypothetical protein
MLAAQNGHARVVELLLAVDAKIRTSTPNYGAYIGFAWDSVGIAHSSEACAQPVLI